MDVKKAAVRLLFSLGLDLHPRLYGYVSMIPELFIIWEGYGSRVAFSVMGVLLIC